MRRYSCLFIFAEDEDEEYSVENENMQMKGMNMYIGG